VGDRDQLAKLTHANLIATIDSVVRTVEVGPNDRFLSSSRCRTSPSGW
jgi:hypothetical protein